MLTPTFWEMVCTKFTKIQSLQHTPPVATLHSLKKLLAGTEGTNTPNMDLEDLVLPFLCQASYVSRYGQQLFSKC